MLTWRPAAPLRQQGARGERPIPEMCDMTLTQTENLIVSPAWQQAGSSAGPVWRCGAHMIQGGCSDDG